MMKFTFFTLTLGNFFESYFILQLNYIKGLVFSQIYTNTLILITLLDFHTISHTPNIISIDLIYVTPQVSQENELNLAPPTLYLSPKSSIFIRVSDGGVFKHRRECLWSEGKTLTFAILMQQLGDSLHH
jgi:hypothetical protein